MTSEMNFKCHWSKLNSWEWFVNIFTLPKSEREPWKTNDFTFFWYLFNENKITDVHMLIALHLSIFTQNVMHERRPNQFGISLNGGWKLLIMDGWYFLCCKLRCCLVGSFPRKELIHLQELIGVLYFAWSKKPVQNKHFAFILTLSWPVYSASVLPFTTASLRKMSPLAEDQDWVIEGSLRIKTITFVISYNA